MTSPIELALAALNFTQHHSVTGLSSIDALFSPRRRCGIYVLHLAGGAFYVGQSVDVTRRFLQHCQRFPQIQRLSFKQLPSKKHELDVHEIAAIHTLERQGFPLMNIVHASITYQSSLFDDLVTPAEQKLWLADPASIPPGTRQPIDEDQRLKYHDRVPRLWQRPDAARVVAYLRWYVEACIPRPHISERSYWGVSCLPATHASTWPRIACFNLNEMETFVVGWMRDDPRELWAILNVSAAALHENDPQRERVQQRHPEVLFEEAGYVAAGHDQMSIEVHGAAQLERLLGDPVMMRAARLLNLHLMRKRTNLYARYHCYDLADLLLGTSAGTIFL